MFSLVFQFDSSIIKEHDDMEATTERFMKRRNLATLELAKYLVEVACLLDAEVKLRNFEDLLDTWREKYNIDYDMSELEPSAGPEDYYSDKSYYSYYDYYSGDYSYYSDYGSYYYR